MMFTVCAVVSGTLCFPLWGTGVTLAFRGQEAGDISPERLEERYGHRDFVFVAQALEQVRDWQKFAKELGNEIGSWPRELGAAFALEAAAVAAQTGSHELRTVGGGAALRIVEAGCQRLGSASDNQQFGLRWALAAGTLAESEGPELPYGRAVLSNCVLVLFKRFEGDSELRFIEVVLDEQIQLEWLRFQAVETAHPRTTNQENSALNAHDAMTHLAARYRALVDDAVVGPKAALRLGVTLLARGEAASALPVLAGLSSKTSNADLACLSHFYAGEAQIALNHRSEAEVEFQRALVSCPGAQSVEMSLAALLFLDDRRDEAGSIVHSVLSPPGRNHDPVASYPYGDFDQLAHRLEALREAWQ